MYYDRRNRSENSLEEAQVGMGDYGDSSGGADVPEYVQPGVYDVLRAVMSKPAEKPKPKPAEKPKPAYTLSRNDAISIPQKITRRDTQVHEYGYSDQPLKISSTAEGDITWMKPGVSAVVDAFRRKQLIASGVIKPDLTYQEQLFFKNIPPELFAKGDVPEQQVDYYLADNLPIAEVVELPQRKIEYQINIKPQPVYQIETPEQVMARIQAQQLPPGAESFLPNRPPEVFDLPNQQREYQLQVQPQPKIEYQIEEKEIEETVKPVAAVPLNKVKRESIKYFIKNNAAYTSKALSQFMTGLYSDLTDPSNAMTKYLTKEFGVTGDKIFNLIKDSFSSLGKEEYKQEILDLIDKSYDRAKYVDSNYAPILSDVDKKAISVEILNKIKKPLSKRLSEDIEGYLAEGIKNYVNFNGLDDRNEWSRFKAANRVASQTMYLSLLDKVGDGYILNILFKVGGEYLRKRGLNEEGINYIFNLTKDSFKDVLGEVRKLNQDRSRIVYSSAPTEEERIRDRIQGAIDLRNRFDKILNIVRERSESNIRIALRDMIQENKAQLAMQEAVSYREILVSK